MKTKPCAKKLESGIFCPEEFVAIGGQKYCHKHGTKARSETIDGISPATSAPAHAPALPVLKTSQPSQKNDSQPLSAGCESRMHASKVSEAAIGARDDCLPISDLSALALKSEPVIASTSSTEFLSSLTSAATEHASSSTLAPVSPLLTEAFSNDADDSILADGSPAADAGGSRITVSQLEFMRFVERMELREAETDRRIESLCVLVDKCMFFFEDKLKLVFNHVDAVSELSGLVLRRVEELKHRSPPALLPLSPESKFEQNEAKRNFQDGAAADDEPGHEIAGTGMDGHAGTSTAAADNANLKRKNRRRRRRPRNAVEYEAVKMFQLRPPLPPFSYRNFPAPPPFVAGHVPPPPRPAARTLRRNIRRDDHQEQRHGSTQNVKLQPQRQRSTATGDSFLHASCSYSAAVRNGLDTRMPQQHQTQLNLGKRCEYSLLNTNSPTATTLHQHSLNQQPDSVNQFHHCQQQRGAGDQLHYYRQSGCSQQLQGQISLSLLNTNGTPTAPVLNTNGPKTAPVLNTSCPKVDSLQQKHSWQQPQQRFDGNEQQQPKEQRGVIHTRMFRSPAVDTAFAQQSCSDEYANALQMQLVLNRPDHFVHFLERGRGSHAPVK